MPVGLTTAIGRRESLKLAGVAAVGAVLGGSASASEAAKPLDSVPKEWQAKAQNAKVYQGKIYTVGGAVDSGFSFSIFTSPTGATFFGIDLTKKYADAAVRVVLQAFEKGATLIVVEDSASPGYATIVVAS